MSPRLVSYYKRLIYCEKMAVVCGPDVSPFWESAGDNYRVLIASERSGLLIQPLVAEKSLEALPI